MALTFGGDDRGVVTSPRPSLSPLAAVRSWRTRPRPRPRPRPWRRSRADGPAEPPAEAVAGERDPGPVLALDDTLVVETGSGVAGLADGLQAASEGRVRPRRDGERRDALLVGPVAADDVRELRERYGPAEVLVVVDTRGVMAPSAIAEAFRAGASDVVAGADLRVVVAHLEALFRRHRR